MGRYQTGESPPSPSLARGLAAMASVSIQRNRPQAASETLRKVPPNNPDYGQIALEAVRKGDMAYYYVNTTHPDYAMIAQARVRGRPHHLKAFA